MSESESEFEEDTKNNFFGNAIKNILGKSGLTEQEKLLSRKLNRLLRSKNRFQSTLSEIVKSVDDTHADKLDVATNIEAFNILFTNMGYRPVHAANVIQFIAANAHEDATIPITRESVNLVTQLQLIDKMKKYAYFLRVALVHVFSKRLHEYPIKLEIVLKHFIEHGEQIFLAYIWAFFICTNNRFVVNQFQKALPLLVKSLMNSSQTSKLMINYNQFRNYISLWLVEFKKDPTLLEPCEFPFIKSSIYKKDMPLGEEVLRLIESIQYDVTNIDEEDIYDELDDADEGAENEKDTDAEWNAIKDMYAGLAEAWEDNEFIDFVWDVDEENLAEPSLQEQGDSDDEPLISQSDDEYITEEREF